MVRVVRLERTVSWSQTRRDTNFAIPGYSISAIIPRQRGKSKIFLSVVIYVVKAAFVPFSAIEENPANAGAARLCGVLSCPVPDSATALPNQARYQLRHTRIFNFCHDTTANGKNKDFSACGHFTFLPSYHAARKKATGSGRFSARFLLLFCIVLSLSVLLDQRQRYICSEQICVDGQPERAAHQLHKASHDGKPQPAALRVAGGVPAHKALHQLVG